MVVFTLQRLRTGNISIYNTTCLGSPGLVLKACKVPRATGIQSMMKRQRSWIQITAKEWQQQSQQDANRVDELVNVKQKTKSFIVYTSYWLLLQSAAHIYVSLLLQLN